MAPLMLQALLRQPTSRPPLWLMRQAGRYLPEYLEVRARHPNFIEFCLNPQAATAVTLQPVHRFNLDAAIIFADILTIPHALGHTVTFAPDHGPQVQKLTDPQQLQTLEANLLLLTERLAPVAETLRRTRLSLPDDKAVLGFSGAPFTLACYMLDDKPSQGIPQTLDWARNKPQAFQKLIAILTQAIIAYLQQQQQAGATALQVFDSWATLCPPDLWPTAGHNPLVQIAQALHPTPVILFPRAVPPEHLTNLAQQLSQTPTALSLSTEVDLAWACQTLQPHVAIQGNLDPHLLTLDTPEPLQQAAQKALQLGMQKSGYIINLGHGLTPQTRIERVQQLADLVRAAG